MDARHADAVAALRRAVLDGPGSLPPAERHAIAQGEPPADLGELVEKVVRDPRRIGDADVSALLGAGRSQDELFETIVSAALGAGLHRLEAGLRALG